MSCLHVFWNVITITTVLAVDKGEFFPKTCLSLER